MERRKPEFDDYRRFVERVRFHAAALELSEIMLHHMPTEEAGIRYGNYALAVWPGGIWLARYILDHPSEFSNKRILDIGTGSGIVAIAAAKVGGIVDAIDEEICAIHVARINIEKNAVRVNLLHANWKDFTGFNDYDVITTSDTFYDDDFDVELYDIARYNRATIYAADGSSSLNLTELPEFFNFEEDGVGFAPLQNRTDSEVALSLPTAVKFTGAVKEVPVRKPLIRNAAQAENGL